MTQSTNYIGFGKGLKNPVEEHLDASGVDLSNGGGLEELSNFKNTSRTTNFFVFDGLSPDKLIFSGNSLAAKKLYLLYYPDSGHHNVITNMKAVMAKNYICNACDVLYDKTLICDKILLPV